MTRPKKNSEHGATAVIVAGSLLMLMALASMAIDGGIAFNERRGTQNAADLAALSAAWQDCNRDPGVPNPRAAARATAASNGYSHTPGDFPQVDVRGPGGVWTVRITERNDTSFGRATPFAPDELTVVSQATATCTDTGLLEGYAIFGSSTTCGDSVSIQGSDVTIDGGVHSNQDLLIPNNSATVAGSATYRINDQTGAGIDPEKYFGSSLADPVDLSIAEYRMPLGPRAQAADAQSKYYSWNSSVLPRTLEDEGLATLEPGRLLISAPGIYFTTRDFRLQSVSIELTGAAEAEGVTFVAAGTIATGGLVNFRGYDPLVAGGTFPVAMFSDRATWCNPPAIFITGSGTVGINWTGLIYAPRGPIVMSSPSADTIGDGSVIGYRVDLQGSSVSIEYPKDDASEPNYRVELID